MQEARVGIIGGSGLYELEGMTHVTHIRVNTPFGDTSDPITLGEIKGVRAAFLPRHGHGHVLMPSELPYKANIYALKSLGVEYIIAISAVGSLKEKIKPTDIVIPDQIIDRTFLRSDTFFGNGVVAHVAFADPYCPVLSDVLYEAVQKTGCRVHDGGTAIVMEGPQFSTRAESELYRSWGADVIFMTGIPEAKLAREAEICYATMAVVTDYDCWNEVSETVSTEMVVENFHKTINTAKKALQHAIVNLPPKRDCVCGHALENAIITSPEKIPDKLKKDLSLIIGKYIQ
ncbi:MAG: S-methyl-5'-thioadenosine phosphorylase [Dehalococcoidia bacterium]|nr:MAG: S-methyl-5'-thioadenosine phosphorylase [Dehalococcoidia bacterium]